MASFLRGDGDRLLGPDHHEQPLGPGEGGVEEIPLQHGVVGGVHRQDHAGVFGSLALVDGHRVGQGEFIEIAEIVRDLSVVNLHHDRLVGRGDGGDPAQIAIVNGLVVVVPELEHPVPRAEDPPATQELGAPAWRDSMPPEGPRSTARPRSALGAWG